MTEYHISPRKFGAVGDGVTDNADALIAMRDFMLLDRRPRYVVEFEPGQYDYSNNRWLRGVRDVTVLGNGAKLRCIANKPWERDFQPFLFTAWFEDYGDKDFDFDQDQTNAGYRIGQGEIRDDTVTLLTPADAQFFVVGGWVMVHGFVHQWGGAPPNMRYFQFTKIAAIDAVGGVLTLENRLTFQYRDDWQDFTDNLGYTIGKPRISPMNMQNTDCSERVVLRDLEILNNPVRSDESFSVAAVNVEMHNVATELSCAPSFGQHWLLADCRFRQCEVDKNLDTLRVERCQFSNWVLAATGVQTVSMVDCVTDRVMRLSPLGLLHLERVTVLSDTNEGTVIHYFNSSTTRKVVARNCRFPIGVSVFNSSSPKSLAILDGDTNQNHIFLEDNATNQRIVQQTQLGTSYYSDNQLTNKLGEVKAMFFANGKHTFEVDFTVVLSTTIFYDPWLSYYEE